MVGAAGVGALAALLLTATPGGSTRGPSTTGKPAVQHGRWVSLDPLAAEVEFDANDLPAIASSDPRVVYESFAHGIQRNGYPQAATPPTFGFLRYDP